jgi:hypothetical protein
MWWLFWSGMIGSKVENIFSVKQDFVNNLKYFKYRGNSAEISVEIF